MNYLEILKTAIDRNIVAYDCAGKERLFDSRCLGTVLGVLKHNNYSDKPIATIVASNSVTIDLHKSLTEKLEIIRSEELTEYYIKDGCLFACGYDVKFTHTQIVLVITEDGFALPFSL